MKKTAKKRAKKIAKKVEHGFVFVGNGDNDPETIGLYRCHFKLNGKPVEVPEPFAGYLRTNSHFKEV